MILGGKYLWRGVFITHGPPNSICINSLNWRQKGAAPAGANGGSPPAGFTDKLSWIFGSYHLNDYGIFYEALRRNAIERSRAWLAANPSIAAK